MLALIAGKGALPRAVSDALDRAGRAHEILSLQGFAPDLPNVTEFRVEALGKVLQDLRARGVTDVCFAGAMQRPRIDPGRLHPLSLPLVPRLAAVMQAGDDRLLREVIAIFEEHGMTVRGAHDLAPDLLASLGPLGGAPSDTDLADAARGAEILSALGPFDIGQACVVARGHCLGVETLQGTDALLEFVAGTRAAVSPPPSGILVKRAKPGQDLRIDMPTIGPKTVEAAAHAGLNGIAVEAHRVLLLERERLIAAAAEAGLALWGMP